MSKAEDNPKLVVYISFDVDDMDKITKIIKENKLHVELLTTKDYFQAVKYKFNAPKS